jgi:hypothetical protein
VETGAVDNIGSLTNEQALRAMGLLYEYMPEDLWEGGRPSRERLKLALEAAAEDAPGDVHTVLQVFAGTGTPEAVAASAALSRFMLQQLADSPSLRGAVMKAVEEARQPRMFLIDPVTGAIIIGILLATSRYEKDKDGSTTLQFGYGVVDALRAIDVPKVLSELPQVFSSLPAGIWSRFFPSVSQTPPA